MDRRPGPAPRRALAALGLAGLLALAAGPLADPPAAADPTPAADPAPVRFGRDVRPLLSDRCFACHGADPSSREAGLRLDLREEAVADRDGVRAVVPGDAGASELWRRITSDDPDVVMPPPHAKKRPLTDAQKEDLARWIEDGAVYEEHWAWQPPVRPEVPTPADAGWARDEIDAFVRARQEAAGVEPSPQADATTLCRRVFLDLTGLPPTVEELDAFQAEAAGDDAALDAAYRRLVKRLLGEEPYRSRTAEHLTTPWLDAARYADTIGIHTDNGRQMWLWREWVLEAFRDDVPYDRFVTEQLAGDLLPDATTDQQIASGFLRSHVITDEGGVIPDEYLVEYAVDRVNTTSAVFLGLTAGCARCHDHKYDPLTQEDYYGLLAYFNSNEEPGLYSQTPDSQRAYEPFLEAPRPEQQARIDALGEEIAALEERLEAPIPGEAEGREAFLAEVADDLGLRWSRPVVLDARSTDERVELVPQDDGSLQAEGPHPMNEDYELVLEAPEDDLRLLALECLSTPGADTPGAGRAFHGNIVITSMTVDVGPPAGGDASGGARFMAPDPDGWRPVSFRWAWADRSQKNHDYEPTGVLDPDTKTRYAADGNAEAGERVLVLLSDEPFAEAGETLRLRVAFRSEFGQHSAGRIRVQVSPLADTARLPVAAGRWYLTGR